MKIHLRRYRTPSTFPIMPLFAATLSACSPVQVYQPPEDLTQTAHLKLLLRDTSLLAGVGAVYQIEGETACGKTSQQKKMIVISNGNPLLEDLNPDGTYIPAGRKFMFHAMGLRDGFHCRRFASFVPNAGSRYEITLENPRDVEACPMKVDEISKSVDGAQYTTVTEFAEEECNSNN